MSVVANAITDPEHTNYYISRILPHYVPQCVEMVCAKVTSPLFTPKTIQNERERILMEMAEHNHKNPYEKEEEAMRLKIWNGHPVARPTDGDEDTVRSITRDGLMKHFSDYYTPDNIVLSIAGHCDADAVLSSVDRQLGHIRKEGQRSATPLLSHHPSHGIFTTQPDDTALVTVVFNGLKTRDDQRAWAEYDALTLQLQGDDAPLRKRLMQEVGIYSLNTYSQSFRDAGLVEYGFLLPASRLAQGLDIFTDELNRAKQPHIRHRKKAYLERSDIFDDLESDRSTSHAATNARLLLKSGELYSPEAIRAAEKHVTSKDVQAMAQRIYTDNMSIFVRVSPENVGYVPDLSMVAPRFK